MSYLKFDNWRNNIDVWCFCSEARTLVVIAHLPLVTRRPPFQGQGQGQGQGQAMNRDSSRDAARRAQGEGQGYVLLYSNHGVTDVSRPSLFTSFSVLFLFFFFNFRFYIIVLLIPVTWPKVQWRNWGVEAHNPQHFSDGEIAWWTISDWLAGRCGGLPANLWSSTTWFPRLKNAVDNRL